MNSIFKILKKKNDEKKLEADKAENAEINNNKKWINQIKKYYFILRNCKHVNIRIN